MEKKIEPGEAELEELNQKLNLIQDGLRGGIRPTVTITWFVPDPQKAGGTYETATEQIKKIDPLRGVVVLARAEGYARQNAEIPIADILDIRGGPVDFPDDIS